MVLTGRFALLVLAATALVAPAVRSLPALLAVDGALLVLALVDVALAGRVRDLRASRSGDTTTRLGEPATVTLTLRNDGRRRVTGQVRDAWVPSAGVALTRRRLQVEPGRVARSDSVLVPTRRGSRRAERVVVRSLGPLGLAGRQGSHRAPWVVRVLPAFPSRRHLPSRLARLRELDGRTALQVRGQGTEFDSLREYVAGDDVRSIDWRATARAADVMVRTWRPERDRRIVLVVDTGRTSAARLGDGTRLDAAMDAAQLLAALASRAGDRVDLLAYDRRVRADVRGAAGAELLAQIAAALTDVEPELVETDAAGLVAAVLARVRQRALVVLLSPLEPPASPRWGFCSSPATWPDASDARPLDLRPNCRHAPMIMQPTASMAHWLLPMMIRFIGKGCGVSMRPSPAMMASMAMNCGWMMCCRSAIFSFSRWSWSIRR